MGFMDKAKKMAEQAQAKLDEAQKQFNQQGTPPGGEGGGQAVDYDQHGRPVPAAPPEESATPPHGDPVGAPPEESATPPHGDPVGAPPPPEATAPPPPAETTPPPAAAPPDAPPAPAPPGGVQDVEEDRNHPSHKPPKLSSGDPLQG